MKGQLIFHQKKPMVDGSVIEMKIWKVSKTPFMPHGLKYSLVYIESNRRVIGYDNAERKGDHFHLGDKEEPYEFKGIENLLDDFISSVNSHKMEKQ